MRFDSFSSMLDHWAEIKPLEAALKYESDGETRTLSYAGLRDAVIARADALRDGRATCLGLLCDGSLACVIELFAAVRAGLQLVLLDAAAPVTTLMEQIDRTDVDALWGDEALKDILLPALRQTPCLLPGGILLFTSGTTEHAKAVVLTENGLCASAWNGSALLPLGDGDVLLCALPLSHVFGLVCGLLWGLYNGACVALGSGPARCPEDCARFRPTALALVPFMLGRLMLAGANPELRLVLVGAADCPVALVEKARQAGIRVSFGYGLTETSSGVALSLGEDPYAMTVCPEFRVRLAADGEILIESDICMMQGYYKALEDTRQVFQGSALRTGDLGKLDEDGRLRLTGRKKEVLTLWDGAKLSLPPYERRVEAVIGPRDFAVMAREGRPLLVLNGEAGERDGLLDRLNAAMADLPEDRRISDIAFLSVPLPRTASGKIKRWALQKMGIGEM